MSLLRQVSTLLFFGFAFLLRGQEIQITRFASEELNDERILQIYLPKNFGVDPLKTYPLTIILDSGPIFDSYIGTLQYYINSGVAPEHIVVGIKSDSQQAEYDFGIDLATGYPDEFGVKYMNFVHELLNTLDENYPLSFYTQILGHGYHSGAFINYFLVEEFPAFNAYISIDPEYFEGFHFIIDQKSKSLDDDLYYYFSNGFVGKDEEFQKESLYVENSFESIPYKTFKYYKPQFKVLDSYLRTSQYLAEALRKFYMDFAAISPQEYESSIKNLGPKETIEYLKTKYEKIQYLYGNVISIRPNDIYLLESNIIDKDNGDYLKDFGNMIIDLYPEEPLGYYYVGLYYEKGQSYRKSLVAYKQGFEKVSGRHELYDGYFKNIERVLEKINYDSP
ncbi:MAG: alpha/beta hydrolase-fold protein [Flavobacteriaceae bacterium]